MLNKDRIDYIDKICLRSNKSTTIKRINNASLLELQINFISNEKSSQNSKSYYLKRNLILIEILDNFVINDNIVDIVKMKMLLPQWLTISDDYYSRLVYTNILIINKAIDQLNLERYTEMQFQLMNKVKTKLLDLDSTIDKEIRKNKNIRKSYEQKDASESNLKLQGKLVCFSQFMSDIKKDSLGKVKIREKRIIKDLNDEEIIREELYQRYNSVISVNRMDKLKRNKTSVAKSNKNVTDFKNTLISSNN